MLYIVLGGAVLFVALYLLMIFPAKASEAVRERLAGRNYAHRGLHDIEAGIPENSRAAFRAAVENGYGSELDVRLTADDKVVVFHDSDLLRACGAKTEVGDISYDELREYKLFKTDETAPLFSEVLEIVGGKEPLIVEIKPEKDRQRSYENCRLTNEMLRSYKGDYCIESFDPYIMRWFYKNSKETVRGHLAMRISWYRGKSKIAAFLVSRLLTNVLCRPHFIAYKHDDRCISRALAKLFGAMSFVWTLTKETDGQRLERSEDGIIFEGYRPTPRYRR